MSEVTMWVICTMCNICSGFQVLPEAFRHISYVQHTSALLYILHCFCFTHNNRGCEIQLKLQATINVLYLQIVKIWTGFDLFRDKIFDPTSFYPIAPRYRVFLTFRLYGINGPYNFETKHTIEIILILAIHGF